MSALTQIFNRLFMNKPVQHPVTLVQTSLEPIHEEDNNEGCEFLDDFSSLDEPSEEAIK
ncbi:MAG TPA: hypothetical protein VFS25_00670 [Chitinophaga sp.]|uniref:hypothetical protein n=1 Tax=Chitinophaga sp. TaxID=1869181 RepID=UPI002DB63C04|nr:hypothetical protein [Chitinophaga sp.]HEU4551307.1 hypothetical protein [Chitinophaga sp.]